MKATPEQIWPLVSDVVTNTKRFAAETFDAEWLDGATGPAVGVRFRGHVKRNGWGPVYWSVATINACEPGREFAFSVALAGRPAIRWRYQFAPAGDGTDVTESFELQRDWWLRLYWALLGWARGKTNVENMRTTLERIKAAAEGGELRPPPGDECQLSPVSWPRAGSGRRWGRRPWRSARRGCRGPA